jgi:hypothetical protein
LVFGCSRIRSAHTAITLGTANIGVIPVAVAVPAVPF